MAYDFDTPIQRRGTGCIKWDLFPEEVLPMFIADMDFPAAPVITEAIIRRAKEHPVYGYTFSEREIFPAFRDWLEKTYGERIAETELLLLSGIVPALSLVSDLVEGKSITTTPNYGHLLSAPSRAGNEMLTVPLRNEHEQYTFDFDALEQALTPDTKLFYLCSPHNPVGRVWKKEELEALSAFAQRHNLLVVSDEIHCELVYDRPHIPFFTVSDYARNHSICLYAPGKTYNLAGNNLAVAVIHNQELKQRLKSLSYAMSAPGIFNTAAAAAAYTKAGEWRDTLVSYLRGNRDYLEAELNRRFPLARHPHTEGTYLQWIDFRPYGAELTGDWFLKHAGVALTGGAEFGGPGYVRLNFGCPRAQLTEALDRIENALNRAE